MTTIVTRVGKGYTLTWADMDANLTNLNNDKLEVGAPATDISVIPVGTISSTDVQAALAELDTAITDSITASNRTLVAGTGISITNTDGVSGDVTISCTVSSGVTSVNGNDGAITAEQIAAAATAGYGYTPANAENAGTDHTHSGYVSTNMTHGAVGSLCFALRTDTGSEVAAGSTLAGSSLSPASVERTANISGSPGTDTMVNESGTLSGTWRCLGYSASAVAEANATLWQRIS